MTKKRVKKPTKSELAIINRCCDFSDSTMRQADNLRNLLESICILLEGNPAHVYGLASIGKEIAFALLNEADCIGEEMRNLCNDH